MATVGIAGSRGHPAVLVRAREESECKTLSQEAGVSGPLNSEFEVWKSSIREIVAPACPAVGADLRAARLQEGHCPGSVPPDTGRLGDPALPERFGLKLFDEFSDPSKLSK